jgi:hypothetical protein
MHAWFWLGKVKERGHSDDINIDGEGKAISLQA